MKYPQPPATTTLAEEWAVFCKSDVAESDDKAKLQNAFYAGAQAALILSAEAMGKIRDEINEFAATRR